MSTAIQIGVSERTVTEASKGILSILKSGQDQETIREALKTFRDATTVRDVRIEGCQFTVTEKGAKKK